MKRISLLQLLLSVSVIAVIALSGIIVGNPRTVSATSGATPVAATPTPTSTSTATPTSTPTSTPTGVGYDWSHVSFEAGVVSNNPFKIARATAQGTPQAGATPLPFVLGQSGSTDVKGFVLFRWRDQKAWDCASAPTSADADPDCESGAPWSRSYFLVCSDGKNKGKPCTQNADCPSSTCELKHERVGLRFPDIDGRFGITFGGSSSSTSASTVAGTGDVSGTANVSWPLFMWEPSYTSPGSKSAFLSLGPGFTFDGNTDRGFQDTHTSYALGLALIGGTPWTMSPHHALEVAVRAGFASVEVPALMMNSQNIETNSIGEPRFHHVWGTNLSAEVQAPLSDSGGYLTLGGEFFGNGSFFGGSSLPVSPWTLRLGMAVPFSKVANLFTDAANTFNPASPPAAASTPATSAKQSPQ